MDLQAELHAFRTVDPRTAEGLAKVRAGLARKTGLIVAAAANRVREAAVSGLERSMVQAFHTLCEEPVRRDPGCTGKFALLHALEEGAWLDPDVFVAASTYVQLEPAWPKPVETAGAVRRYGLAGLVRLRWEGTPARIADHFSDPDPHVRSAAALAVPAWGEAMGGALLRFKLHMGTVWEDGEVEPEDGDVLIDTLLALIQLDRPGGLQIARAWLGDSEPRREVSALALGQSRVPEAVGLLRDAIALAEEHDERRTLYIAMGTLRLDGSRAFLLDALAGRDAALALEALRPHRYEPDLLDEVRRRIPASLAAQAEEILGS